MFYLQACWALTALPAACRDTGPDNAHSLPPVTASHKGQGSDSTPISAVMLTGASQGKPHCRIVHSHPPLPPQQQRCPKNHEAQSPLNLNPTFEIDKFNDIIQVRVPNCGYQNHNLASDSIQVKGRLRTHSEFWSCISAPNMVMSTIKEGFKIWFSENPP